MEAGSRTPFKAIDVGDLFLFKLHSHRDYIVGGGFFLKFTILPSSLAWEAFGIANGAENLFELKNNIYKYRKTDRLSEPDPNIGCVILSMPFYFDEQDWIPVPYDWSKNIVQGKTYDTRDLIGLSLYKKVNKRLETGKIDKLCVAENNIVDRFGREQIIKPRIGQGAFKILITDVYNRRCAFTGEKTLPVLEAAHIKPYSLEGSGAKTSTRQICPQTVFNIKLLHT